MLLPRLRCCEWSASSHDVQHAPPARLVKEMEDHMENEADAVGCAALQVLAGGFHERPVDEERPSDHILPRHEAPVAAVVTYVTIIAHHEQAIGGDHQLFTLEMRAQGEAPFRGHAAGVAWGNGGEVIPVRIVAAVAQHVR